MRSILTRHQELIKDFFGLKDCVFNVKLFSHFFFCLRNKEFSLLSAFIEDADLAGKVIGITGPEQKTVNPVGYDLAYPPSISPYAWDPAAIGSIIASGNPSFGDGKTFMSIIP